MKMVGPLILIISMIAGAFVARQQTNKQPTSETQTINPVVSGLQQTLQSSTGLQDNPKPTDIIDKTLGAKSKATPTPTLQPVPTSTTQPQPTQTPQPTQPPQLQVDTEFLSFLNNYKAKIDAAIITNTNTLSRYESERQAMIDSYAADGLTPSDSYLETTSRIINSTRAQGETIKGIRGKIEEWIARTKAGEYITRAEVDSFVGPLLNQ